VEGNTIYIKDVGGMVEITDGYYLVGTVATNTFELQDSDGNDIDSTGYTTFTTGGTYRKVPDFQYEYEYILPSDCLKVQGCFADEHLRHRVEYAREGTHLLANSGTANIIYTSQVTDPDSFDPLFIDVLVLELALRLTGKSSYDKTYMDRLRSELQDKKIEAKLANMKEADAGIRQPESWVAARLGYGQSRWLR
jgi:hypothetical protein